MDLFKQNYINPRGFCHKINVCYVFHYIFPLLICILLVKQTNCSFCASPECLFGYDAGKMPRPHTASGLCGRHCKYSWICDPCQILNSTAGNYYDLKDQCIELKKKIYINRSFKEEENGKKNHHNQLRRKYVYMYLVIFKKSRKYITTI